jgi:hypothetical protein
MKHDKVLYSVIAGMLLILAAFLSRTYAADVNVTVSPPPSITIPADPDLIQVPNTDIYYVPDVPDRVVFYHGNLYRMHDNHWFRSSSPSGQWSYEERPPDVIVNAPGEYHGEHHVLYHDLKSKWKEWRTRHEMTEMEDK